MGAYLHGAAGDRSRDDLGEWGMMAGDLLDRLPQSYLDARHAFNRLK
jgi:NAD(P)H-hydrate repair Nnr-like enzyme with NAD(P)H-hydrate dehydratase domain